MKIKFTSLPTSGGKIQVSFNGGSSFTEYNVEDVRESGIPLDDGQDYSLIQIKSSSSVLKDLNVVKNIKVTDSEASGDSVEDIILSCSIQSQGSGSYIIDRMFMSSYYDDKKIEFYLDLSPILKPTYKEEKGNFYCINSYLNAWNFSYDGDKYEFDYLEPYFTENLQGKRIFIKIDNEYKPTNLVLDFS